MKKVEVSCGINEAGAKIYTLGKHLKRASFWASGIAGNDFLK